MTDTLHVSDDLTGEIDLSGGGITTTAAGQAASGLTATPAAVPTNAGQASPPLAQPTTNTPTGVAEFEKTAVARVVTKVSGATAVDDFGQSVSLDDIIRVVGEFKVVNVHFGIDPKDGSVVRTQIVKPTGELTLVPWNPADPNDNGIVRARP